jgi:hypothetical protein
VCYHAQLGPQFLAFPPDIMVKVRRRGSRHVSLAQILCTAGLGPSVEPNPEEKQYSCYL